MNKALTQLMYEIERIIDRIPIFMGRLGRFFEQLKQAPMVMWEGTANEPGNRIMLIMFLIGFVGGAVYLIVSFFKASWRKKLNMLLVGLVAVICLLIIFYFALMK